MKENPIFEGFAYVDPELIQMAATRKFPRSRRPWAMAALAACLLVCVGLWRGLEPQLKEPAGPEDPELIAPETEPEAPTPAEPLSQEALLGLVYWSETASESETGKPFLFSDPMELDSQQLYALFLFWAEPEELEACRTETDSLYEFPAELIREVLSRHLRDFDLELAEVEKGQRTYDRTHERIRDPLTLGGGSSGLQPTLESLTWEGRICRLVVNWYDVEDDQEAGPVRRRVAYTLEQEDNDIYFLSALEQETPLSAELRLSEWYDVVFYVGEGDCFVVRTGEKNGLVNSKNQVLAPMEYDALWDSSQGLIPAWKDGLWGYLNTQGEVAIPFVFDQIGPFREDLAAAVPQGGTKFGFIDPQGSFVVAPTLEVGPRLPTFQEGLALHERWDGTYAFLNREGVPICDYVYEMEEYTQGFRDGYAPVKREGKYGILDQTGREVVPAVHATLREAQEALQ